jgi:FKBP-type peptidyl-prolyl cis-trans isomerase 2
MTIKENSAVSFHYTLTDDDGQTLDSSAGKDPLAYLHGAGNIIPGLENALAGKQIGDSMVVAVTAAEGYGEVQQELIKKYLAMPFKVLTVLKWVCSLKHKLVRAAAFQSQSPQ